MSLITKREKKSRLLRCNTQRLCWHTNRSRDLRSKLDLIQRYYFIHCSMRTLILKDIGKSNFLASISLLMRLNLMETKLTTRETTIWLLTFTSNVSASTIGWNLEMKKQESDRKSPFFILRKISQVGIHLLRKVLRGFRTPVLLIFLRISLLGKNIRPRLAQMKMTSRMKKV